MIILNGGECVQAHFLVLKSVSIPAAGQICKNWREEVPQIQVHKLNLEKQIDKKIVT